MSQLDKYMPKAPGAVQCKGRSSWPAPEDLVDGTDTGEVKSGKKVSRNI